MKVKIASFGWWTIGFPAKLKDVFIKTGTPVNL